MSFKGFAVFLIYTVIFFPIGLILLPIAIIQGRIADRKFEEKIEPFLKALEEEGYRVNRNKWAIFYGGDYGFYYGRIDKRQDEYFTGSYYTKPLRKGVICVYIAHASGREKAELEKIIQILRESLAGV